MKTDRYYQSYLKNELANRMKSNPRYSLRAFAKALNLDPSTLSRILNGQKIPTPALSRKILSKLELNPKEIKNFLNSMAMAYEEEGVQRKKAEIKEILLKKRSKIIERELSPNIFRMISDWYHYAILQLLEQDGFRYDPQWIAAQLNIQEEEASLAISRMIDLGFLDVSEGRLVRKTSNLSTGEPTTTTPALRRRIKQVSQKSVLSLENDPISIRNHTTMTMSIDPDQLPLAKEMIQDFMDKLSDVLQVKKKQVYELQINLFPLQRGP